MTRRIVVAVALLAATVVVGTGQSPESFNGNVILGRPTDSAITVSVLAHRPLDVFVEYGPAGGEFGGKTATVSLEAEKPSEIAIEKLQPNTRYRYRVRYRQAGEAAFAAAGEAAFQTQRAAGSTFTFALQGDSHPERGNSMYSAELYTRTLQNVAASQPDFYVTLGDDFSIDPLANRNQLNEASVNRVYADQRRFLGLVGRSAPLFLVNGNHEEAAAYLLNGTPTSPPVLAGKARNLFFPLPAPGAFYSGDEEPVEFVGLRRDYYAWTWGDALFVVIDPYWHSTVVVDAPLGGGAGTGEGRGGGRRASGQPPAAAQGRGRQGGGQGPGSRTRDLWQISIGDVQYHWLEKTLSQSKARYKFVFAHHVNGTGRGAVELADLGEWGGKNRAGEWEFDKKRPGWSLPIHQLMVKAGVTAFFQGHDHLYAHQQKDGVVYQETPNPGDASYTVFNKDAYRSGDVLPNSGFLRVTVSPASAKVEYVRSYLPKDETKERKNGEVALAYSMGAAKRDTK